MKKPGKGQRKTAAHARRDPVAATDAAKNFGRLADRVREEGATYIIERHGRAIAQIGPVEQPAKPKTLRGLVEHLRTAPKLDAEAVRYIEEGIAIHNQPDVPANRWER